MQIRYTITNEMSKMRKELSNVKIKTLVRDTVAAELTNREEKWNAERGLMNERMVSTKGSMKQFRG